MGPGSYKYVCVNGEYRFAESTWKYHKDLVRPGEVAQSAGSIFVFEHGWRINDGWSSSLKIGQSSTDQAELQKIINKPYLDTSW